MGLFLLLTSLAFGNTQSEILETQDVQWPAATETDPRIRELWSPQSVRERHRRTVDGKQVFDYTAHRDEHGFRLVPDTANKKELRHHVFLIGCSNTFGVGVEDHETFAAQLSAHLPHTRVVNMGVGGGSIVEPYFLWKNFRWNKIYHEEEGLLIYSYIIDHLERLKRTWRYLQWAAPLTPYYKREGRDLIYQGILKETPGYKWARAINDMDMTHWWLRGVSHFIPFQLQDGVDEMAFYFSQVRDEYLKQFPKGRFVVSWYAHSLPWGKPEDEKKFRQVMAREKIELWDDDPNWDHFQKTGAFRARQIPGDGHPSAFANAEYSQNLAKRIKSTTGQIVK